MKQRSFVFMRNVLLVRPFKVAIMRETNYIAVRGVRLCNVCSCTLCVRSLFGATVDSLSMNEHLACTYLRILIYARND